MHVMQVFLAGAAGARKAKFCYYSTKRDYGQAEKRKAGQVRRGGEPSAAKNGRKSKKISK